MSPPSRIDWPPQLVDAIARRRSVVFLGAGISRNSKGKDGTVPPTWLEFLNVALGRCKGKTTHIKRAIKSGDYLTACEWLRANLDDRWNKILREQFVDQKYKASNAHNSIYQLDSSIVATPNFDKIFDGLAIAQSEGTAIIKTYYDDDLTQLVRGEHRVVLKIHGTIDAPDKMIFSRKDYAKARINNSGFYEILRSLMVTHTFLLLGCGLNDPDVELLFESYRYTHPPAPPHYVTMPSPVTPDLDALMRETRNVRFLAYSPRNSHAALSSSLEELVQAVEARREELASTRGW